MKKTSLFSVVILGLLLPILSFADGDHSLSPDDILKEILSSQNVAKISEVNCQEISDEQFEQLGEASMSVIHPNEEEHEFMDQMMGGEGSESLKTMHITMGQNYLGCGTGMMGGGMIGGMDMMSMMGNWSSPSGENSSNNMMGYNMMGNWWGIGWIFMILFWILIVVVIIALIKWIIKK